MRPQTPNSRSQAGRRGQPRAVRRAPCASLSRRTRQKRAPARSSGQITLGSSALREPQRPRGRTISRSPRACRLPSPGRSPRPRPRPLAFTHPLGSAARGLLLAHVGCNALAPCHAPACCSLAAGVNSDQPGGPLERSPRSRPSRLSCHPAPLSFPTQGVKGGAGGLGGEKEETSSRS